MYKRILLAYDGSDASAKAFATACRLAVQNGAQLWILSVARGPDVGDDVETEAVIEHSRQYHRHLLAQLKASLARDKIDVHLEVRVGHPAEQIISEADRVDADLIVVGDRGRSKFARLLLG